jgi:hypothetical protein
MPGISERLALERHIALAERTPHHSRRTDANVATNSATLAGWMTGPPFVLTCSPGNDESNLMGLNVWVTCCRFGFFIHLFQHNVRYALTGAIERKMK